MPIHPGVILGTFTAVFQVRKHLYRRDRQTRLHKFSKRYGAYWALIFQPYALFMLMITVLYITQVKTMIEMGRAHPMLDPKTYLQSEVTEVKADGTFHKVLKEQEHVASWLRLLALMCPVFVGGSLVVTMFHLALHLPRRLHDENIRWYPSYSHDLAMFVVLLPLVYGLFALDNVILVLRQTTGDAWLEFTRSGRHQNATETDWESMDELYETMYHANFEMADLYEAWALYCFAQLCFMRVSRQIHKEVPTVQYLIRMVKEHLSQVGGDDGDEQILDELTLLNNPKEFLYEPLKTTSSMGVMVFVYTYAVKSFFLITLTILKMPAPFGLGVQVCGEGGIAPVVCGMRSYVDGAAFLASSLAIYNLIVLEHRLRDILERDQFKPFEKFLSVKIMVSIAFFQDIFLKIISSWLYKGKFSHVQLNLCYSCLICAELLLIVALVFFAWKPRPGDWYNCDQAASECVEDAPLGSFVGRLAMDETFYVEEDSSFVQSRWLTTLVERRSSFPQGSEPEETFQPSVLGAPGGACATIELRGDVSTAKGRAIANLVNTLTENPCRPITAVYRPAAMLRSKHGHDGDAFSRVGTSMSLSSRRPTLNEMELSVRPSTLAANPPSLTSAGVPLKSELEFSRGPPEEL
eukprot:TRINITY_DN11402_c0_g1_i2.p1 TRINITY_DN11402_c0_g1~~TRINITY_DN11402_c0_g1_i2.p1  ORF type:complete len:635 (+),score=124.05 TRINITY_DN11402_c0_g1_i2:82-1986(+)